MIYIYVVDLQPQSPSLQAAPGLKKLLAHCLPMRYVFEDSQRPSKNVEIHRKTLEKPSKTNVFVSCSVSENEKAIGKPIKNLRPFIYRHRQFMMVNQWMKW